MTKEDSFFAPWGRIPLVIILVVLASVVYFVEVREGILVIVGAGYGVILLQSRLHLWRIVRGFPGSSTLRRLLRSAFFFLPLPFLGLPIIQPQAWGIPAGVACGALFFLFQLPELKFNLSAELISVLPALSQEDKLREIFHPILGAIAQEYFYRGVVLYVLIKYLGFGAIVVAALLFGLEHFMHFDAPAAFDKRDYMFQVLLGLGLGSIFYFSQSLLGCMLGHIVYNSPGAIQAFRRSSEPRSKRSEG